MTGSRDGDAPKPSATLDYDAVVVGAGFAGLYMLHRLRDGLGLKVGVLETAGGVGGTWYWNRYPGARCDIDSIHYCYSFSDELMQEWNWSERFPAQPEILAYLNHVADKFALRPDIQFETTVTAANWDEDTASWGVETDRGDVVRARYFIAAVGCLSTANIPDFADRDRFAGETYFTGDWPHGGVDFSGKRVGIIGTGSTGLQVIPPIAGEAAELTVFQRTPAYAAPLGNRPLADEEMAAVKANYAAIRREEWGAFAGVPFPDAQESSLAVPEDERRRTYEKKWAEGGFAFWLGSYQDILFDETANKTAADFVREQIRARVRDPATAERLCPKDYPYGTKRQPLEQGYFETFNQDHVRLVDLREQPIERFTEAGIRTSEREYPLDAIVFATGFDAFTGSLFRMNIRGREGQLLQERWSQGARSYLGIATHGLPNFFIITGPQSPSVLFNMPLSIEQHVEWISKCIEHLRNNGLTTIEARAEAEQEWVAHTREVADQTLFPKANSWYLGANIPGKPRQVLVYLGGGPAYHRICREKAESDYEGFDKRAATQGMPAPGQ